MNKVRCSQRKHPGGLAHTQPGAAVDGDLRSLGVGQGLEGPERALCWGPSLVPASHSLFLQDRQMGFRLSLRPSLPSPAGDRATEQALRSSLPRGL